MTNVTKETRTKATPTQKAMSFEEFMMLPEGKGNMDCLFGSMADCGFDGYPYWVDNSAETSKDLEGDLSQLSGVFEFFAKWIDAKIGAFNMLSENTFDELKGHAKFYGEDNLLYMGDPVKGEWFVYGNVVYARLDDVVDTTLARRGRTNRLIRKECKTTAAFLLSQMHNEAIEKKAA